MPTSYHHGNLRQELIDLAVATLNEKGIEKLSLRQLARELGVSHTAPLRHFANKGDLLKELAEDGVRRLIERTREATLGMTGRDYLLQMTLSYVAWARENPAYHHVLRNPDVMRHKSNEIKKHLEEFADNHRREIRTAQQQGWRTDQDPEVLFLHLVTLIAGTAIAATDPIYEAPLNNVLEQETIDASLRIFLG